MSLAITCCAETRPVVLLIGARILQQRFSGRLGRSGLLPDSPVGPTR